MTLFTVECEEPDGRHFYDVRLLHEFGSGTGYLGPEKVAEIWERIRGFEVLFSENTQGRVEPFLSILMNPRSVWLEIYRLGEGEGPIGIVYISSVIPNYDAKGHFAFWDSKVRGRQIIFWRIMKWMFSQYKLHRISAETPPYQRGVIRLLRRLGFVEEGERREAINSRERWWPLIEFGILESELDAAMTDHVILEEASNG